MWLSKLSFISNLVLAQGTPTPDYQNAIDQVQNLYDQFVNYLPRLGSAILILLVGLLLAGRLKRLLRRIMVARHVEMTLVSFLSQLCYWAIIIIVIIGALSTAGAMSTPLSAVLGASALAIGLALQNTLSNLAAGVLIILFRHFRAGDDIETGGLRGIVE